MKSDQGYYVYILECNDNTLYTGWTIDVDKRVTRHNQGKGAKYTRSRLPVVLRYVETVSTRQEALQREYFIKHLPREKRIQLISLGSGSYYE